MCLFQKPLGEKRFFLEQPKLIDFENICKQYVFIPCCCTLHSLSTEWHTSFSWKNELLWVNISFLLQLLCLSSVHCPHLQTKMFCLRYAKYNNLWFSDSTYVQKIKMIARWRQDPPRSECGYCLALCRPAAVTPRQIIPCKFLPGGGGGGGRGDWLVLVVECDLS